MNVFPIWIAAAAILAPASALADEPGYDCRALDLNGNRLIERSEFNKVANPDRSAASGASAEAAAPAFRRADRNDSGYLSEHELWRLPVKNGGGWIAVDKNRDGRIAPSEFEPMWK
jgi:hypothetical protein